MLYANSKWTKDPFPAPSALAGGGLALIVLVVAWIVLTATPERLRHPAPAVEQAAQRTAAPAIAQARPIRMVYRNSVIPGGVHSAAELAFALANDAVAKAHYAGFDVASAHVVRVEQARLVHVSYRVGDKIYWTKNKVRLAAGEQLLSDGTHLVRARCGNRIADESQAPVFDKEPAPEVLDALMVSADGLVDVPAAIAMVSNAVLPSAPPAAVRVEQPPEVLLASNMQVAAPWQFVPSLNPTGQRTFTLSAPPVSVHTPAAPPSETALADAGVPAGVIPATPVPPAVHTPAAPPSETALADAGVPASVIPATPAPDVSMPPSAEAPVPESPADFPLGPTDGPQTPIQATVPPKSSQVPEPGSVLLAAIALAAIALVRRRARRRQAS